MEHLTPWQRAITAVAFLKVLIAVALYAAAFATSSAQVTPRHFLMAAHVAVYGSAAVLLIVLGRRDLRATVLGVAFLLTAAVFADNALNVVGSAGPAGTSLRALFALQVDAFTGFFLWYFIREFPRVATFGARRRIPEVAMRVSLAVGVALFVLNIAWFAASVLPAPSSAEPALRLFARQNRKSLYWPIQYALALSGLVVLVWKARVAPITERRRVSILIGGLVIGIGPAVSWIFLSVVAPAFKALLPLRLAGWVIYPCLLSTPFTTAYAVLVHRALNAPLIIRRAIQYALARYSILTIATVPALLLFVALYQQRERRMLDLLGGANGVLFATLALLTILVSRGRREVLEKVDRRFFREQYDARRILGALAERSRAATSRTELADSLRSEIDRALHLMSVGVLFIDADRATFDSPLGEIRPLAAESRLATLLSEQDVLDVDLERRKSGVAGLSTDDLHWLADAGARLLLPMKRADGQLLGLIVLGDKKSELPFSKEDRMVLSTVASTAAIPLTYLGAQPAPALRAGSRAAMVASAELATICMVCGWLDDTGATVCHRCASPMVSAPVPRIVAGKFQLLDRIGEGAMGVVYRGRDLELDRLVALKTLPRVMPEQAARWRREARAMAAIAHPNLALIYGAESWNGMPILIVEFLSGGTLSDRLASGPLDVREGLILGIALADVLGALHNAGILHGDIKPSNIGFTAGGAPKLLDFGLAQLLSTDVMHTTSADHRILGTPLYASPEALAGRRADPSFDLWSTCMVLFEAVAGASPVQDTSFVGTLHRIRTNAVRDLSDFMPSADAELSAFFRRAFSANLAERPLSAGALSDQLEKLERLSA